MIIIIIIFANGEAWEIKIAYIFSRGTPVVPVFPFFWGSSTHKKEEIAQKGCHRICVSTLQTSISKGRVACKYACPFLPKTKKNKEAM